MFDAIALYMLVLLSAQGLLNYVFSGTPLEAWKQLFIVVLFCIAASRLERKDDYIVFYFSIFVGGVLFLTSILRRNDVASIAYSSFFYISWIPFYIIGKTSIFSSPRGSGIKQKIAVSAFLLIVVSGIGLMVQLNTPYLDFLNNVLESTQLQIANNEARRLNFVFVASTIVMPTLVGFFRLLCMWVRSSIVRSTSVFFLILSAIPTGSLGSIVMLFSSFLIASLRMKLIGKVVGGAVVFIGAIYLLSGMSDVVNTQFLRIISNDTYSESNVGRIIQWKYALDFISSFGPVEHLVGVGLGSTNEGQFGSGISMHGESSFFSAYIEGGLFGLFLQITPFFLLLSARVANGYIENVIYGLALFVCCAVAPIFGGYGIQCVLGYIAGVARRGHVVHE